MGPNVLIVEDEHDLRSLIAEAFEERGIRTTQARDGVEALEQLRNHMGIQLMVSDIRMPRMGGYELVEKALAASPELKVLMITGYRTDLPSGSSLTAREIRILPKPIDLNRLGDLAVEMLGRP